MIDEYATKIDNWWVRNWNWQSMSTQLKLMIDEYTTKIGRSMSMQLKLMIDEYATRIDDQWVRN